MDFLRKFAAERPVVFVVMLALLQPVLAIPFIVGYRVLGGDMVQLRLLVPTVQSVFVLWLIWALGWWQRSGLGGTVRNVHLLWFPALIHFVPALIYGTVAIDAGWVLFYFLAVLTTGISEEGFARGIAVPALMKYGKWIAVLVAAAIFSAGHLTNAFFEQFTLIEWVDKFVATFGFAVLYGALFLRTRNIWPLIFLHTLEDYLYVTSGTAGPFISVPLDFRIHMMIAGANLVVGLFLMRGVTQEDVNGLAGTPMPMPARP